MTVDFEKDWESKDSVGAEKVTPLLLDLFDDNDIRATFFVETGILENNNIVSILEDASKKHEIASHGVNHHDLASCSSSEIRQEISESKRTLDELGFKCLGFRAPFFSVIPSMPKILKEEGYTYDSSCTNTFFLGRKRTVLGEDELRKESLRELPIHGFTPFNVAFGLPFVRAFHPLSMHFIPKNPKMFYLHPCEFLGKPPGKEIPFYMRQFYRRNRGERAWALMECVLDKTDVTFRTCLDALKAQKRHEQDI